MANEEQLSILRQGFRVWNKWREKNANIVVDLSGTEGGLRFDLSLFRANLNECNLSNSNLQEAYLDEATLIGADLSGANLTEANLNNADLSSANLYRANLYRVNLTGANLQLAHLNGANLSDAGLDRANLSGAEIMATILTYIDLSEAKGLDSVQCFGQSSIGTDTIRKSKGKIPNKFLRGCGLSDWEIEMVRLYNPELSNEERNKVLYKIYDLQVSQAIQISPLFISYSHGDGVFVDKLEGPLNKKGIRFWRDIHDMKAGRIENQIDTAIRQNPTVLLVLSEHSLKSDWVEHEVRTARGLEQETNRDVLCPIALDDSWKKSPWPERTMEQIMEYNILDFSEWENDVKFEGMFRKLIDGLELFYKG